MAGCGSESGSNIKTDGDGAVNIEAPSVSNPDAEEDTADGNTTTMGRDSSNAVSDTNDTGIFTVSGQEFIIGMEIEDGILNALGTAEDVMEAPSCHFDGNDTIYVYPGFSLYTYRNGERDILYLIELTGDNVTTALGAKVGMHMDEIKKLYGNGTEGGGTYVSYPVSEDTVLKFGFTEDIVTWIEYEALE